MASVFETMSDELAAAGFMGYRYDLIGAHDAGEKRHAGTVIREWFPDASSGEVVPMGDCVLFNTKAVRLDYPPYFIRMSRPWVHSEDVYRRECAGR